MERRATTEYTINEIIARRWSGRHLDPDRPIEDSQIQSLIESARWAPSSRNEQPWRYLIFSASVPTALEKARSCLSDGNAWAKAAPVLILSMAKRTFTRDGTPNHYHKHDTGAANMSLVLEAVNQGLMAHQMAGFDPAKARAEFQIPDEFVPLTMIAVGYELPDDAVTGDQRERMSRPRTRRELSQIAARDHWNPTLD